MQEKEKTIEFVQKNFPDGAPNHNLVWSKDFLQSSEWLNFQEAFGRKTHFIENEDFSASIIEHQLPIVGKYFYAPRGPVLEVKSQKSKAKSFLDELIKLAKKEKAGWIRIEPASTEALELIKENIKERIVKAPYDVQPKETFVLDIVKSEEQLLAGMKPKTRYNINLAKKKGVIIVKSQKSKAESQKYIDAFLNLTREMAARQGIAAHPENYYRKMLESFPEEMLQIYVAEYEGQIIAANLLLFYGQIATYLHGASSNVHRNVMAPFLLQWQAILDAKKRGCTRYDFGGIQTAATDHKKHSDLSGVTNFKTGFSPRTESTVFAGTYDVVVNARQYALYKGLQRAKAMIHKFRK